MVAVESGAFAGAQSTRERNVDGLLRGCSRAGSRARLDPTPGEDDMDDQDQARRIDELPEHERDDDRTIGGGVLSEGGTAIDRGTGTLDGDAQDRDDEDDDDDSGEDSVFGIDRDDFGAKTAERALGHDR
jgi:hypothetical protein